MVDSDNVSIKNESTDSSIRDSEVTLQQEKHKSHSSQCKWNEKKKVNIGTLQTLGGSQGKTESQLAAPTENASMVGVTLLIWIAEIYVGFPRFAVIKGTVSVHHYGIIC